MTLAALRADLAEFRADIAITAQAMGDMRAREAALVRRIELLEAGQTALPLENAPDTAHDYATRRLTDVARRT